MSFREALGAHIPYLRRYARALTGSQRLGDESVRATLTALVEAPGELDLEGSPRLELYRAFHRVWHASTLEELTASDDALVASLPALTRQSLLLTAVEGFSVAETADILGLSPDRVRDDIASAKAAISNALTARVLIIEDEPVIAMHIRAIVEGLGHSAIAIARTRSEAVEMAARETPELVLADISLADGSSGIDAVTDILTDISVPVIFITAFPERLLTGLRPEPTYLITKPFEPETVTATIGQALLVHRETAAQAAQPV